MKVPVFLYRLVGHETVPVRDVNVWAEWWESANRTVARTPTEDGLVSTVFLGLDHGFGVGVPVLFETQVFGGAMSGHCERYSTWAQAAQGHRAIVAKVRVRELAAELGAEHGDETKDEG